MGGQGKMGSAVPVPAAPDLRFLLICSNPNSESESGAALCPTCVCPEHCTHPSILLHSFQVSLQVQFISASFPVTQLHRMQNYDNNACLQIMSKELVFLTAEMLHKCTISLQLKSMTKEIKFPGMLHI